MARLGFMSLSGMLIKNAVVLIDEINLRDAADDGGHSRPLRDPVPRALRIRARAARQLSPAPGGDRARLG
jgi:multidrug efflux pump subunit AcrB